MNSLQIGDLVAYVITSEVISILTSSTCSFWQDGVEIRSLGCFRFSFSSPSLESQSFLKLLNVHNMCMRKNSLNLFLFLLTLFFALNSWRHKLLFMFFFHCVNVSFSVHYSFLLRVLKCGFFSILVRFTSNIYIFFFVTFLARFYSVLFFDRVSLIIHGSLHASLHEKGDHYWWAYLKTWQWQYLGIDYANTIPVNNSCLLSTDN